MALSLRNPAFAVPILPHLFAFCQKPDTTSLQRQNGVYNCVNLPSGWLKQEKLERFHNKWILQYLVLDTTFHITYMFLRNIYSSPAAECCVYVDFFLFTVTCHKNSITGNIAVPIHTCISEEKNYIAFLVWIFFLVLILNNDLQPVSSIRGKQFISSL